MFSSDLLGLQYVASCIIQDCVVTVILENIDESGRRSTGHVNMDTISVDTPLNSLVILVQQESHSSRMDVYVDCYYQGSLALKSTFRQMSEMNMHVEVVSPLPDGTPAAC